MSDMTDKTSVRARLLETGVVVLENPIQRYAHERISFRLLAELNPEEPELAACALERLSGGNEGGFFDMTGQFISGMSAYRSWARRIRSVAPDFHLRPARPSRVLPTLMDAFWPGGSAAGLPAGIGRRWIVSAKEGDASAFALLCDAEGDEFLYVNRQTQIRPVEIGGNNWPFLLAESDVAEALGRLNRVFPDSQWSTTPLPLFMFACG